MKQIFEVAKKEWSFFAFIFISPVTLLAYIALFPVSNDFPWLFLSTLSFILSALFFLVIIHKMREKIISEEPVGKVKLSIQLLAHTLKTYAIITPLAFATLAIFSTNITRINTTSLQGFAFRSMIVGLPIGYFISIWLAAGYALVILQASSKRSIRRSFVVSRHRFKELALFTLIQLALNAFAFIRQTYLPKAGLFWSVLDIAPLYLSLAVIILGITYISKSLSSLQFK